MLGLETSIGREQRISTSLLQHLLLIIVPMHLGKPVGSMDPLLVDMGHRWAGDIENVVAVGHTDGLTTDKTKLTEGFTWVWISVVGSSVVIIKMVSILLMVFIEVVIIFITGTVVTFSRRGFINHHILEIANFGNFTPFSE